MPVEVPVINAVNMEPSIALDACGGRVETTSVATRNASLVRVSRFGVEDRIVLGHRTHSQCIYCAPHRTSVSRFEVECPEQSYGDFSLWFSEWLRCTFNQDARPLEFFDLVSVVTEFRF